MNIKVSTKLDSLSIFASAACTVQCLLTPVLVSLIPALGGSFLDGETFHLVLLSLVIPISVLAFWIGCGKHRRFSVMVPAGLGLLAMVMAAVLGTATLGEAGEKSMTLFGALLLAFAHVMNYRLCRKPGICTNHNCSQPEH